RRIAGALDDRRVVGAEIGVHLVRRDVKKTKRGLALGIQRRPVGSRRLKQTRRAVDVRANERVGRVYRAVDVRLGREVRDGVRAMLIEDSLEGAAVADVDLLEDVPRALPS